MTPTVTFVVPCYKLAHLLSECVNSILAQTYKDFEILIMDDCSPDHTPQVARSFDDPRVKHIRNEPNLGHLRNYNKGIELARGKYVWLISADDFLRRPYVLERYVNLMEAHPRVGYVFCPGVALCEGKAPRVVNAHGRSDWIKNGRRFLWKLLNSNSVVAASGMARKECYERVSHFPLDMPWGGDWYLWCAFALHYQVAYIAEPLVNYRTHELSMTTFYTTKDPGVCTQDDLTLYWRIKDLSEAAGHLAVANRCRHMLGYRYAQIVLADSLNYAISQMTLGDCKDRIVGMAPTKRGASSILASLHLCLGDQYFWRGDRGAAVNAYRAALVYERFLGKVWIKLLLLYFGGIGLSLRRFVSDSHHRTHQNRLVDRTPVAHKE